jgi:hypothetical protein
MVDSEAPRSPRKSRGPYYGIELGVLFAVTILYFAMTCSGAVSF